MVGMGCDISVTVRFALLTSSVRDVCVHPYGHQCEGVRAALDVNGPWHGQCVLAVRVGWAQRGPPHGPLALLIMDRIAGGKVSE